MLDYESNQSDTCEVRLMLFNAMVVQVLLYRIEVWDGTISLSVWNEIEKIQKMFLAKHLQGDWPIECKPSEEYTSIS